MAVTAAPTGRKANKAIEKLLARALGVRASAVTVIAGKASRDKVVRIDGLTVSDARKRLATALAGE